MKNYFLIFIIIHVFGVAFAGTRIDDFVVTASESNPNGGGYNKARIYVDQVSTSLSIIINKPLIVFEGYDPGYYTKPKEKEGRTGIQDFIDDIEDDKQNGVRSQLEVLMRGNPDASPAVIQQYDIIYVNWVNGTDYLENNEKVAKAVINWVNAQKVISGSTEPNVIIGRSMGSVITRRVF